MHQQLALFVFLAGSASAMALGNASLPRLPAHLDKEQLDKILMKVDGAPEWIQQSLRSTLRSAASMSTGRQSAASMSIGSQPRALSVMAEALCQMAMWIVPVSILMGALPALGDIYSDKNKFCSIAKTLAPRNPDGSEKIVCPPKSKSECYNGCEWDEDKNQCGSYAGDLFLILTNPDAGSPAKMSMDQAIACNKLAKASCTGDCQYNDDSFKCEPSEAFVKKYACEAQGSQELMTIGSGCEKFEKGACTGQCAWNADESKCDVSTAKFYQLMFGKAGGTAMANNLKMAETCAKDSPCGSTAGCGPSMGGDSSCGKIIDAALMSAMVLCAMKPKAQCTDTCAWSMNEGKCEVSMGKLGEICGWNKAVADTGSMGSQVSLLGAFLFAAATLLTQG